MQLAYAMFADAAQLGPDGKISMVGGDFDTISVAEFPAQQPYLSIVIRLNVAPTECDKTHQLRVALTPPGQGAVISTVNASFTPHVPASDTSRPIRSVLVVNLIGLQFEAPGTYTCHLTVDGQSVADLPLHLVEAPVGA